MKNEQLERLRELQKIDSELIFLRTLRSKRPQELEKDRRRLQEAQQAVERFKETVKQTRIESDRGELDLRKTQSEIDKLQIALNAAKNNQEYQVLLENIKRLKEEMGNAEEVILGKLGDIDRLNQERSEASVVVEEIQKELKVKEEELRRFLEEIDGRIAAEESRRAEQVKKVIPDALDLYQRVLGRYRDSALALVENHVCQGCHMSINNQLINRLMLGKELVQCLNCLRILYLPE